MTIPPPPAAVWTPPEADLLRYLRSPSREWLDPMVLLVVLQVTIGALSVAAFRLRLFD